MAASSNDFIFSFLLFGLTSFVEVDKEDDCEGDVCDWNEGGLIVFERIEFLVADFDLRLFWDETDNLSLSTLRLDNELFSNTSPPDCLLNPNLVADFGLSIVFFIDDGWEFLVFTLFSDIFEWFVCFWLYLLLSVDFICDCDWDWNCDWDWGKGCGLRFNSCEIGIGEEGSLKQ